MLDSPPSPISLEALIDQEQMYKTRLRYLEKQRLAINQEIELIQGIHTGIKQAIDHCKEVEKDKQRYSNSRTWNRVCDDCGKDFKASWSKRKYCNKCLPKQRKAQCTKMRAVK